MDNVSLDVLKVNKDLLPYQCDMVLGNELFTLQFNYNATAKLFTVDLYKDGKLICAGEPIVYGVPLWSDVYQPNRYPSVSIIPLDPSEGSNSVTYDNLSETVLLFVVDPTMEVAEDG